ncbi:GlcG/HbpS family heme-binding protein [Haloplanus rubicundus]|uniref:Heme-binding protein n=1 Tax=Haloplanus rubicundus TaxID=1547898 RepID=A0A345EE29_9EURY|nr:heme-binding protein [Haloplanus rubicundus]AXG10451.1 heme-binding protein [Haloplanus rubicundus]
MSDSITLDTAKKLIDAAERRAEEIDNPMVIAVTNDEGNLVAQRRMDDAWLASVSIARNKAYTSAALDMPTHELAEPSEPGNSLYGLQTTDEGRIVVFGGGYPLLDEDGDVVGAFGVSGGAVEQDMEVAEAGVARWEELLDTETPQAVMH